jgi:fructoselysine 6-kinase
MTSGGTSIKAAAIGDNCIDVYPRLGRQYPTGNAVDTAVNLRKLGMPASVISTTGDDANGTWMLDTLRAEGLDVSHLKVGHGATAVTYMDMNGLERVHGDYVEGVLEGMEFDQEDVAFAAGHDLVHSAIWGKAEGVLPDIKRRGATISFDYADKLMDERVESTLPYVDFGFYSYRERDRYIEDFLRDKVRRGMRVAVSTLGERGSIACDGARLYACGAVPATVVNTVGAGDGFIAGFLHSMLEGGSVEDALACGSRVAARVVGVFGPWVEDGR